ncbi:uncharacterized protein LOC111019209 [Momordica charantia]|uniref:Uncharacterized protein LOC111019209 n=1 Tax=Momordica charantia TaxID=3673 RepID=A0A6J1DAM7_MOMCH|nr:uncharacterized protein LOC111019209 [Momordica charantia]
MRSEGNLCLFSYLKFLLQALVVGLFLWILMVGLPESRERPAVETTNGLLATVGSHVKQVKVLPNNNHQDLDLNFMSKVRVPKGPDPIHNRRVGINGGPPSRA